VAANLDRRLTVIANRVDVPPVCPEKPLTGPLQLLFVGRGGPEKRIHLIGRAARRCSDQGLPVVVTLVGDVAAWLEAGDADRCRLTGPIDDPATLGQLYQEAHLVLITSSREGFPLTVMEGMAQGCVPLCTAVGGIAEHVRHQENGWLLPADDDDAVVEALVAAVATLAADRQTLARLSASAYGYAGRYFSGERFCEQYQRVIKG
jgi:glycosyltransferase involved in cell wall biosynthesis